MQRADKAFRQLAEVRDVDGLQPQSVLYVRDGLTGEGRQLIDPNGWAKDGARIIAKGLPPIDQVNNYYVATDKSLGDPARRAAFELLAAVRR